MAKRNIKQPIPKKKAEFSVTDYDPGPKDPDDPKPHFYTEEGLKVHVRPIEMDSLKKIEIGVKKFYADQGYAVEPPTIEIEMAGGVKVKKALTVKNLIVADNEEETDRRKELWEAHLEAQALISTEIGRISTEYLLDGINEPLPENDSWVKKYLSWHFDVPEDPELRALFWKRHVLIKTPVDFARMQSEILIHSASGTLDREDLDAELASFFRKLKLRSKKLDISGITGEVAERQMES